MFFSHVKILNDQYQHSNSVWFLSMIQVNDKSLDYLPTFPKQIFYFFRAKEYRLIKDKYLVLEEFLIKFSENIANMSEEVKKFVSKT